MNNHSKTSMKQYGVTPPISLAEPTKQDELLTETLVKTLRDLGQYESDEEAQRREVVLGKINAIVKEFVKKVSLKKSLPESIANEAGGRIFTFGSYRLGVHGAGADIDTLCVVPVHVDREDFFTDMYEMLKERSEITDLTMVPDAYVPVINFSFSDIPIDLLFARLNLPSIPDNLDLSDNNLLRNLDERCVRSLNGSRVTDEILRLVPSVPTFRTALRCIKVWAKRRAIYSNIMGFFGGVAWAMIVARVCQLYPKALAGTVITKFFRIMQQWKWPQPVLLKNIEDGPLQVRVWNPRLYQQDRAHKMPIITPAYPSMCSTHNVTSSTQQVMIREFQRAADVVDKIVLGQAVWMDLFEKDDFFSSYKYYLQVIASSNSQENQLKWSGLVESKLRQLVMKLEMIENIQLAHPYIKSFEDNHRCLNEQEKNDVAQGKVLPKKNPSTTENGKTNGEDSLKSDDQNVGDEDSQTITNLWTTTLYIGIVVAPKDPKSSGPRKLDISWPISEFIQMVKMWDSYDESCMGIAVNFVKSSQLPASVFGEEGPPPKQPKKRTKPADEEEEHQQQQQDTDRETPYAEPDQQHEDKKRKFSESLDGSVKEENESAWSAESLGPESTTASSLVQEDIQSQGIEQKDSLTSMITTPNIQIPNVTENKTVPVPEKETESNLTVTTETERSSEPSITSKPSPPRTGITIDMKKSDIKLKLIRN